MFITITRRAHSYSLYRSVSLFQCVFARVVGSGPRFSVFSLRSKSGLRFPGLARLTYERILSTSVCGPSLCPVAHARLSCPCQSRSHARMRGPHAHAHPYTGKLVSVSVCMGPCSSPSPGGHTPTLFTGRSVCFSVCSRELLARALGSPFFLFGQSPRFGQSLRLVDSLASFLSAFSIP